MKYPSESEKNIDHWNVAVDYPSQCTVVCWGDIIVLLLRASRDRFYFPSTRYPSIC